MKTIAAIISSSMFLLACAPITVKVGRKERPRPEFAPTSVENQNQDNKQRSLTDLKAVLEKFAEDNSDKAGLLIDEAKTGLRARLRSGISELQSTVVSIAEAMETETSEPIDESAVRVEISETIELSESEWLGVVEDLAFQLPYQWQAVDTRLPDQPLDDVLQAILFDFGIYVRGGYQKQIYNDPELGTVEELSGSLRWRLIPEVNDADTIPIENCLEMNVLLERYGQDQFRFELQLRVGPSLWDEVGPESVVHSISFVTQFASGLSIGVSEQSESLLQMTITSSLLQPGSPERFDQRNLLVRWPDRLDASELIIETGRQTHQGALWRRQYQLSWQDMPEVKRWLQLASQRFPAKEALD